MSDQKSPARTKAEAQFNDAQSEARAREKQAGERQAPASAQDEKTARLKAQRLAREAAERQT